MRGVYEESGGERERQRAHRSLESGPLETRSVPHTLTAVSALVRDAPAVSCRSELAVSWLVMSSVSASR
jgi:hypothetical protein